MIELKVDVGSLHQIRRPHEPSAANSLMLPA